jgi:integrase
MLAKKPLTDRAITALKPAPAGKRHFLYDALCPGLAVRVTDTGAKAFVLVGRFGGSRNPTARSIGKVGAVSLARARVQARAWLAQMADGLDPQQVKRAASAGTLRAVAEDHHSKEGSRLRTAAWRWAVWERHILPALGDRQIGDIKRSEIVRLMDRVGESAGPVMANRVLNLLRRTMNWYAIRSDDFRSPIVKGMTNPERSRDRVLSDDELRAIWAASPSAGTQSAQVFGQYIRFLLLTGARRNEAAGMRWSEIRDGIWTLPAGRNKTAQDLARPLSRAALEIIEERRHTSIEGPNLQEFVFSRDGQPLGGMARGKAKLDTASGTEGWTIHDLRRTAHSLMARAGVASDHAERCLGHVIGGVRGVYDRHRYLEEMALAYEKLSALIAGIVDPQPNVVPLSGRGGQR